jgi:hypothetical protein
MFDVATDFGYAVHDEDFGQTLAVWGFPEGRYLVLPLIGPTTQRDLAGFAVSFFTDPNFYVSEPLVNNVVTVLSYANRALDSRSGLNKVAQEAADPYVFVREAYLQRRRFLIYDGQLPLRGTDDLGEALDALDLDAEGDVGKPSGEAGTGRTVDDLPGLEGESGPRSARSVDDLPGLEDVGTERGARSVDELPGLDDVGTGVGAPAGSDDLPGLEDGE